MKFERPLITGRLIKRYKRFLADIELETGEIVTAHCANTGSMEGLDGPGFKVWLSKSDNPKRKLAYSWELVELDKTANGKPVIAGINTSRPNRLAEDAIKDGLIPELAGFDTIRREVSYGNNSRIDLLLAKTDGDQQCYVEIKNVHLLRQAGLAEFPDCKTARGAKHLHELIGMRESGHRAVMLYVIQCTGTDRFAIAADKDPAYAAAFDAARKAGVEMLAYDCQLSPEEIQINRPIELIY
jgi:sugar fermentation stimulation protein A